MKKVVGKTIAIIVIIALVVTIFSFGTGTLFTVVWQNNDKASDETQTWMSKIDDSTVLSSMTIPGTHDSASRHVMLGYSLQTQNTTIPNQLDNGYRYLDIRLDLTDDGDDFKFIHSFSDCRKTANPFSSKIYLSETLDEIYTFLEENPTETVIFNVKFEDSDDDVKTDEKVLMSIIAKNQDKWYTQNNIPTLGQVRGKVVLCTRFEDEAGYGDDLTGIHMYWPQQDETEAQEDPCSYTSINGQQTLVVQDRYKYTVEDKADAVVETLNNCQASDTCFSINFASLSGQAKLPHPYNYAKYINQKMYDQKLTYGNYGIVAVDFGDAQMAKYLYSTNFNK